MAKKIPKSRKHKKLKFVDPCYSGDGHRSRKNKKLLPNEPPTKDDEQEISNYTKEFLDIKNQAKSNKLRRKKRKKKVQKDDFIIVKRSKNEGDTQGSSRSVKYVPDIVKQKKNESEEKFLSRLQGMANAAIAEAKVEEKYGIEIKNITKKGNAEYVTLPKELSERKQKKRKELREKAVEKKKMKLEEPMFELQKETIDFGEVALAPPIFTAKPRKAPEREKPGKKPLFLKKMLESGKATATKNPTPLSTKWKDMPSDKRKQIEIERLRAIEMYRMLKKKKLNS